MFLGLLEYDVLEIILYATFETLYMTFVACLFGLIFGVPLGVILYLTQKGGIKENLTLNFTLNSIVNVGRSIPFLILLILVIPITELIVGTFIGTTAAIVPLAIGSIPFIARLIETTLFELPAGLHETAKALGATNWQIVTRFYLPEALPGIVNNITNILIVLINYTAMAGVVGGGGLGYIGIQYGYQSYNPPILITTVIILIILVQSVQSIGLFIAKRLDKR